MSISSTPTKIVFALVPGMLLADEGLRSGEGTKGNDSKSSAEELVKNFLQIHESSSDKDAAPRRYMTFLNTYKRVYNEKKDGVVKRQQHLQVSQFSFLFASLLFSPSSVLFEALVRHLNFNVLYWCYQTRRAWCNKRDFGAKSASFLRSIR